MVKKFFALLRGINVGANNRIKMPALAAAFTAGGADDVATYIQSGNVIFGATSAKAAATSEILHQEHSLKVPIVMRSVEDFAAATHANPYAAAAAADPKSVHMLLPQDRMTPKAIAAVDVERSPGDAVEIRSDAVYLWTPNGIARTKFTAAYLDKTLGTVLTARNWTTVLALHAMSQAG